MLDVPHFVSSIVWNPELWLEFDTECNWYAGRIVSSFYDHVGPNVDCVLALHDPLFQRVEIGSAKVKHPQSTNDNHVVMSHNYQRAGGTGTWQDWDKIGTLLKILQIFVGQRPLIYCIPSP